jgi:hypothetical protein
MVVGQHVSIGPWRRIPLGKLRNDRYVPLHPELTELLAGNLEHIRRCKRLVVDHRARWTGLRQDHLLALAERF